MSLLRVIPLVIGLLLAPALAEARSVARPTWQSAPLVGVAIVGEHGQSLTTVSHRGTTFVAGELGHRYEIVLTNNSAERLEVVVSVDGRDVLNGKPGDLRQRGYVLAPFGTVTIDGFRRSLDHVAAFRFSDLHDSFAARLGTPQNVGVIGVAVFRERAQQEIARPHGRPNTKSAAPSADAAPPRSAEARKSPGHHRRDGAEQLGTEFGETRQSHVRTVSFVRRSANRPDFRTMVRYDSEEGLIARGVPIGHVAVQPVAVEPQPWPGARDNGFAQPPPPRRR